MTLPANWTTGQSFSATAENNVEIAVNADTNAIAASSMTGMVKPVQALCRGDETFTIASGSVTQIAGTSINGASYSPSVGDRILIVNAPATTGVGTAYSITNVAPNGIYLVTNNVTNLSVSRAADMSGTVNPAGLLVYNTNLNGWESQALFTVTTPSTAAAFTWGSSTLQFNSVFNAITMTTWGMNVSSGVLVMGNPPNVDSFLTTLQTGSPGGAQTLTLPPATTCLIDGEQFITLTSTYTLTSQTAAQKLFNASSNGAVTLGVGTYFFECYFSLSSMSASSGAFGWDLTAGTATISGIAWDSVGNKAALATAATPQSTANTAANVAIVSATTNTVGWARIGGKVRVSVAGTVTPQVSLGVAAAAVVGTDSYFRIWGVGSNTVTTFGAWS
jgi:hypothetical protein